jgi:hypothetical protein
MTGCESGFRVYPIGTTSKKKDNPMDCPPTVWGWLTNPDIQRTLAFIGGGIVVVVGAIWKVYEHYDAKTIKSSPLDVAELRTSYLQLMVSKWSTLPLEALKERVPW